MASTAVYSRSHYDIAVMHFVRSTPVKIDVDIWVIHAFQKKSVRIKTPQMEVDLATG